MPDLGAAERSFLAYCTPSTNKDVSTNKKQPVSVTNNKQNKTIEILSSEKSLQDCIYEVQQSEILNTKGLFIQEPRGKILALCCLFAQHCPDKDLNSANIKTFFRN